MEIIKFYVRIGVYESGGIGSYVLQSGDRTASHVERDTTEDRVVLLAMRDLLRTMRKRKMRVYVNTDNDYLMKTIQFIQKSGDVINHEEEDLATEIAELLEHNDIEIFYAPEMINHYKVTGMAKGIVEDYISKAA